MQDTSRVCPYCRCLHAWPKQDPRQRVAVPHRAGRLQRRSRVAGHEADRGAFDRGAGTDQQCAVGTARPQPSGGLPDSAAADFYVGPKGGVFFAGNHAVVIPAQAVCDPKTSSYGPSTWDAPCSPLQSQLLVHAEVRRKNGMTWVDFTPSLRFVPSTNPGDWAWIVMYTPNAIGSSGDLSDFNILWANSIGGTPVDETPTDATLRTYVDTFSGISIRRIKHFSGYLSGAGRNCEPGTEGC